MKLILSIVGLFFSSLISSQYIMGLSATQNGVSQIKARLNVYLPNFGEFKNYTLDRNQNTLTVNTYYYMGGGAIVEYLENDFYIDIPNNGNYTLKVNMFVEGSQYCLEDTKVLNFTTPIDGTVSLSIDKNELKFVEIFPNPANKILNINSFFVIKKLNVYDTTGKMILNQISPKTSKLDVSSFQKGIYYLELIGETEKINKKFIIKNNLKAFRV